MKFLFLFISFFISLYSSELIKREHNLTIIAQDATWQKLIYYNEYDKKSEINSSEFFLADDGGINPLSELEATLDAYSVENVDDNSSICIYPARYYFLSKHIDLPSYEVVNQNCTSLKNSVDKTKIKSFGLVFVSGYLGNPASAFGHSFLKINTNNQSSKIFDISLSYAAQVPDEENAFAYIAKGLFGGYEAKFSDKYNYSNDLVYSQSELRDMYEYTLVLSDEQKLLLQLHIFEITRAKFRYFFLNRNCAYEMAKFIEIVTSKPIVEHSRVWYAPVESIHRLKELDMTDKVTFHPSAQRELYGKYNYLDDNSKNISYELIQNDLDFDDKGYLALDEDEKIDVLDFTLAYYKFKLDREDSNETKELKNKALVQRLTLKARKQAEISYYDIKTPDTNSKPIVLSSEVSYNKLQGFYPSIGTKLFSIDPVGVNNLKGNELTLFDIKMGIIEQKNRVIIDKFDFIKIKKFKIKQIPFDVESGLSWDLHIGMENNLDSYDYFTAASFGRSFDISKNILLFALAEVSAHSSNAHIRTKPKIGTRVDLNSFKTLAYYGYSMNGESIGFNHYVELSAAYSLNRNFSLSLNYKQDRYHKGSFGLKYFF